MGYAGPSVGPAPEAPSRVACSELLATSERTARMLLPVRHAPIVRRAAQLFGALSALALMTACSVQLDTDSEEAEKQSESPVVTAAVGASLPCWCNYVF